MLITRLSRAARLRCTAIGHGGAEDTCMSATETKRYVTPARLREASQPALASESRHFPRRDARRSHCVRQADKDGDQGLAHAQSACKNIAGSLPIRRRGTERRGSRSRCARSARRSRLSRRRTAIVAVVTGVSNECSFGRAVVHARLDMAMKVKAARLLAAGRLGVTRRSTHKAFPAQDWPSPRTQP